MTGLRRLGLLTLVLIAAPAWAQVTNGGFETGSFSGWSIIGVTSIRTTAFGAGPTDGTYDALATTSGGSAFVDDLEAFLFGSATGTLTTLGNGDVTEGSAIKQTLSASAGDVLAFHWNFLTNETPADTFNDFAFVTIDATASEVADTEVLFGLSSTPFSHETGFRSFQWVVPATGTYTVGVGVVDVLDMGTDSGLLLDHVGLCAPTDSDGDGIVDCVDTCVGPGAFDGDRDGACDDADNCAFIANPDQADDDGDGVGNACDACVGIGTMDSDGDVICDAEDNCPVTPNPGQEDGDGDAVGDPCDPCPTDPDPSNSCTMLLGCTDTGLLYRIDAATGAGVSIGSLGTGCSGIDFGNSGTLYGVGDDSLYTIDPLTAGTTVVGPTGFTLTDISSSAGAAFLGDQLWAHVDTAGGALGTLDPYTGTVTVVGPTNSAGSSGHGLAFAPDSRLFHADDAVLNTLDLSTGAATTVASLAFPAIPCDSPHISALDFRPDGVLYATLSCTAVTYLATIDTTTGVVTAIGQTVSGLDGIAVVPLCGNGYVEAGEQCDDGNRLPGDCCSASCQAEAAGGGCADDDDPCTIDLCDGAGGCRHEFPALEECIGAVPAKAKLLLKTRPNPAKAKVIWKWKGAAPVSKGDFGTPTSATDMTLCVADGTGRVVLSATAPRDDRCGSKNCWKETKTGFKYKDRARTPDGWARAVLKAGAVAKSTIKVKGRGAHLPLPPALSLSTPVRVRLLRSDAETCFEATYSSPTKNDAVQFKAKSD